MDKTALEQLISRFNWWMGISTIAVAIGILGEYVSESIFERKHRRKSEVILSIVFGVLVLGGVVGEYIFGSKLSDSSGELQRQADLEVAGFNAKSEAARKSAAEADERAARASERAGKAEEHAAEASKKAESFRLQIADSNERAAKAEQHAAEANLALERLKTPRTLNGEQQQRIVDKLKPFAGQRFSPLIFPDGESISLLRVIEGILDRAGWVKNNIPVGDMTVAGAAGITYKEFQIPRRLLRIHEEDQQFFP
jgi:hypothetical protein